MVASPALANGTYTAQATEPSGLGNPDGKSETRTFEVDTEPPEVTLNPVTPPSNNTKPSLQRHGERIAAGHGQDLQRRESGRLARGHRRRAGFGRKMGSRELFDVLTSGTYTAVAVEQSSIENAPGESAPVTFVINTNPPVVAIERAAGALEGKQTHVQRHRQRSRHRRPCTSTRAPKRKAKKQTKLTAIVTEGKWTATVTGTLPDGKYTIQATEPSAIGNGPGSSTADPYEVFTHPPTVTMEALKERSKENQPTFKGTASEPGQVTVHVFKGKEAKGTKAAELTATVNAKGEWSVSPGTALPDETYTAVATEPSAIGNEQGESKPSTFDRLHGTTDREDHPGPERTLERQTPGVRRRSQRNRIR